MFDQKRQVLFRSVACALILIQMIYFSLLFEKATREVFIEVPKIASCILFVKILLLSTLLVRILCFFCNYFSAPITWASLAKGNVLLVRFSQARLLCILWRTTYYLIFSAHILANRLIATNYRHLRGYVQFIQILVWTVEIRSQSTLPRGLHSFLAHRRRWERSSNSCHSIWSSWKRSYNKDWSGEYSVASSCLNFCAPRVSSTSVSCILPMLFEPQ